MRRALCLSVLVCFVACGSSVSTPKMNRVSEVGVDAPELLESEPATESEVEATQQLKPSHFKGTVSGYGLTPRSTIFLQGIANMGDLHPVLVLLQADVPNLCAYMQAGTIPKESTFFAAVIIQTQGSTFNLGNPGYTGPAHHDRDNDPWSLGVFRKFDNECKVISGRAEDESDQLKTGRVVLRSFIPYRHVVADFIFSQDSDSIQGHVDAQHCDAPVFFANLDKFLSEVDPADCR